MHIIKCKSHDFAKLKAEALREPGYHSKVGTVDAEKTHLNYSLTDNLVPENIDEHIRELGVKRKIRADATRSVSLILDYPQDETKAPEDFFRDGLEGLQEYFGIKDEAVLYAQVHMDEGHPHMHFAWVPLVESAKTYKDGRTEMQTKLSAKEVVTLQKLNMLHPWMQQYMHDRGYEGTLHHNDDVVRDKDFLEHKLEKINEEIERNKKIVEEMEPKLEQAKMMDEKLDKASKKLERLESESIDAFQMAELKNQVETELQELAPELTIKQMEEKSWKYVNDYKLPEFEVIPRREKTLLKQEEPEKVVLKRSDFNDMVENMRLSMNMQLLTKELKAAAEDARTETSKKYNTTRDAYDQLDSMYKFDNKYLKEKVAEQERTITELQSDKKRILVENGRVKKENLELKRALERVKDYVKEHLPKLSETIEKLAKPKEPSKPKLLREDFDLGR